MVSMTTTDHRQDKASGLLSWFQQHEEYWNQEVRTVTATKQQSK